MLLIILRNLMQTLTINQDESFDIVMENTLLHDMTGVYVTMRI